MLSRFITSTLFSAMVPRGSPRRAMLTLTAWIGVGGLLMNKAASTNASWHVSWKWC